MYSIEVNKITTRKKKAMKKLFILVTTVLTLILNLTQAQSTIQQDKILGEWLNGDKTGIVEIYKQENKYYGKIVRRADKGPKKYDVHNPDPNEHTQLLAGKIILKDLSYDDDEWEDGTIYNPNNGKTYKCVIEMTDNNTLEMTGYVGVPLFGSTQVWTRVLE